jgi:5'(3')-deoxyribonucleotidase
MKKIIYIDLDGVVSDFDSAISQMNPETNAMATSERKELVHKICKNTPGFFENLPLIPGAINAIEKLSKEFEIFFLSTPMWDVPNSYSEKRNRIEKHFKDWGKKRLILTHRKDLQIGHYLIDDRTVHGASEFKGNFIHFGKDPFERWESVASYIHKAENIRI